MTRVGVIGVGAMGLPVARNLLARGFSVAVRDIRPEAAAAAAAAGARACASPRELAAICDVLVLLVVDAAQIDEVLFGPGGAGPALGPTHAVLGCSTIAPDDAARIARRLTAAGVAAVDAPVSGGPARAATGELSMMLAGSDAAIERTRPVVGAMARQAFRIGRQPGDAAKMKLLNNLLAGINLVAGAQALAIGEKLGLDPLQLLQVIGASSGQSWIVDDRMSRALAGDHAPRAAAHILAKDLGLALEAAAHAGVAVPLGEAALAHFREFLAAGGRDEDDAGVLELARKQAGLAGRR